MDNDKFEYSIKVLVIGDNKETVDLLGETLKGVGYDTCISESLNEAEKELNDSKFDLIIGAIDKSDDLWIEFLRRLKSKRTDIPTIFIMDQNDPGKGDFIEAGVDGILSKPFRIGMVEELISSILLNYDKGSITAEKKDARLLVVDDDDGILGILNNALTILGYSPVLSSSGVKALELFKKNKFDLLITDYMMPEMTGKELVLEVKKINPDVATIMITGYPLAYPPGVAKTEGIDAYLLKPFRINQLKDVITELLSEKK